MLITIEVAVSKCSQFLYLKYKRTVAHSFIIQVFVYDIHCGGFSNFKTEVRSRHGRFFGPGFVLMSLHTSSTTFFGENIEKKYCKHCLSTTVKVTM